MSYGFRSPEYDDCPYYEDEYVSKEVSNLEDKLLDCSQFLQAIVDDLYSESPLDKSLLEWRLDELCAKLGVKINEGSLKIERTNHTIGQLAQLMSLQCA